MKHLQKAKTVYVKLFYAGNGHHIGNYQFECALDAKRFVEQKAKVSKPLLVLISDKYNALYRGDGKKV